MKSRFLFENLNPQELDEIIKTEGIIYLPLGTLEWHERHLPFGLDAIISNELCKAACLMTGGCVMPPLFFGTDREHEVYGKIFHGMDARAGRILPGSVYFIPQKIFLEFMNQIVKNINDQGFKKLVIVSAHSGPGQQKVLEKLSQEKYPALKLIVLPGKQFIGGIDHAGQIETSLMMFLRPKLVRLDKLEPPYEAIAGEDPRLASRES